jgi:hypothetical protein
MSDDKGWDEFSEEIESFIKGDEANPKTGGKHNEAKLIEEFASKIKASTSRSVQEILKRGAYCVQAEKQLSPEGNETLLKKLPFGASERSKYLRIGRDGRLPKNIKQLPPSFSTIYLISLLPDDQLKAGIKTGIISARATREDIERFGGDAASKPKASLIAKSRAGRTKALDEPTRTGREVEEEEEEDDDLDFSDEEEDEAKSEESKKTNTIYQALLAEWKGKGLIKRNTWLATPPAVREKV